MSIANKSSFFYSLDNTKLQQVPQNPYPLLRILNNPQQNKNSAYFTRSMLTLFIRPQLLSLNKWHLTATAPGLLSLGGWGAGAGHAAWPLPNSAKTWKSSLLLSHWQHLWQWHQNVTATLWLTILHQTEMMIDATSHTDGQSNWRTLVFIRTAVDWNHLDNAAVCCFQVFLILMCSINWAQRQRTRCEHSMS